MTQLELAKAGVISPQMKVVAQYEGVEAEFIRCGVAEGTIVIPANTKHTNLIPCGIGRGLKTKVNANIGTSADFGNIDTELEKVRVAIECGCIQITERLRPGFSPLLRASVQSLPQRLSLPMAMRS